jgi:hypothetical protein
LRRQANAADDFDEPGLDMLLSQVRESTRRATAALDSALRRMDAYERRWGSEHTMVAEDKA